MTVWCIARPLRTSKYYSYVLFLFLIQFSTVISSSSHLIVWRMTYHLCFSFISILLARMTGFHYYTKTTDIMHFFFATQGLVVTNIAVSKHVGTDLLNVFYLNMHFRRGRNFTLGRNITSLYCILFEDYLPWSFVFFFCLHLPLCHASWRHRKIYVVIRDNYVQQVWLGVSVYNFNFCTSFVRSYVTCERRNSLNAALAK